MYLTIAETAEYLSLSVDTVEKLIKERKIRAMFDGESYVISKDQFDTHLRQMEKYKQLVQEYLDEPIPEDRDIKDED